MLELDCEEGWALKNWCFWTVVLEKTLESPLDCKEIQPVHSKGDQSSVFIVRSDVEVVTPILWPPHVKSWLTGKDPDAGRDWGQEEKGTTEDETAGWHHQLDRHESEWTVGDCDGQWGLVCCDSWGPKSWTWLSDWTKLNWGSIGQHLFKNLFYNLLWIDCKIIVILIFLFSPFFEVILALCWIKKNCLVSLMGLGARHIFKLRFKLRTPSRIITKKLTDRHITA